MISPLLYMYVTHEFVCAVCIGVHLFMAAEVTFNVIFAKDRTLLYFYVKDFCMFLLKTEIAVY